MHIGDLWWRYAMLYILSHNCFLNIVCFQMIVFDNDLYFIYINGTAKGPGVNEMN